MNAIKSFIEAEGEIKREKLEGKCSFELGLRRPTASQYITDMVDAGVLQEKEGVVSVVSD